MRAMNSSELVRHVYSVSVDDQLCAAKMQALKQQEEEIKQALRTKERTADPLLMYHRGSLIRVFPHEELKSTLWTKIMYFLFE